MLKEKEYNNKKTFESINDLHIEINKKLAELDFKKEFSQKNIWWTYIPSKELNRNTSCKIKRKGTKRGYADFVLFYKKNHFRFTIWIKALSKRGRLSYVQKEFKNNLARYNEKYISIRSIQELEYFLKKYKITK